jgi:hypothetical protein
MIIGTVNCGLQQKKKRIAAALSVDGFGPSDIFTSKLKPWFHVNVNTALHGMLGTKPIPLNTTSQSYLTILII